MRQLLKKLTNLATLGLFLFSFILSTVPTPTANAAPGDRIWQQRTNAQNMVGDTENWYSITSSSDGTKLAAVVSGGYIYTSTNSGVTWTEATSAGSRAWSSITSSSDGTKLAATIGGYDDDYIYTSTDSGATWTEQTSAG
ncbi:exo-alpha-sialidase, partial [Candidatus Saccharibacteria bacterium]|nr:exo-alpha-sialidase [Candidatus Saccharibacteria bacterium]